MDIKSPVILSIRENLILMDKHKWQLCLFAFWSIFIMQIKLFYENHYESKIITNKNVH